MHISELFSHVILTILRLAEKGQDRRNDRTSMCMQTANSCMHTVTNKRKVVSLHLFWNVQNNCTSVLHNQSVNLVYDPGIICSLSTASVNVHIQFMKKCTIFTNYHNSDMTVETDNAGHTVTCQVPQLLHKQHLWKNICLPSPCTQSKKHLLLFVLDFIKS